jgi:hypothetical protein
MVAKYAGKMVDQNNKHMPFSLFVSSKRRQKILDSMMEKDEKKIEGDKILNNYKRQLAERVAREKIENGRDTGLKKGLDSSQLFMQERLQIYDSNDLPDPTQVLWAILNRESKFEKLAKM